MNIKKLANAYANFREVSNQPMSDFTMDNFFRFLGAPRGVELDKLNTDDVEYKCEWLNSPHASTLYRMWLIQQRDRKTTRGGK